MSDENEETTEVVDLDPNYTTKAITAMEKAIAEKPSTLDLLQGGLTDYVLKSFQAADKQSKFKEFMQQNLMESFEGLSPSEKLALYNIEVQAETDQQYKLLSPTFGILAESIKANAAAKQPQNQPGAAPVQIINAVSGNPMDDKIASEVPPQVAAGLNTLYQMVTSAQKRAAALSLEKKAESENNNG